MKTILRLAALFITLVTLVLWLFGGPNTGFTKTSVMVKTIDPVTEQEIITWEKRFLPGVEFLAGGLLSGALVFGASFFFGRKQPERSGAEPQ
jgi:hypothetical protein